LALWRQSGPDDALTLLRRAQWHYPGDFWLNYRLAHALADRKEPRYEEAGKFFQATLALRPDNAAVCSDFANLLVRQGDFEKAPELLDKAVRLDPDNAEAHVNRGAILEKKGRLDEAIKEFQTAIRLQPSLAMAHRNLGVALAQKKDHAGALAALKKAHDLTPNDPEVQGSYAAVLASSGKPRQAIDT